MTDLYYTNGMIAVKEKGLLGEKILRFCEMTAQEVLRALHESGFGGSEAEDVEALCEAEERALDAFILEYAPSKAERVYLLAPRDFHNAKALCKAERLGTDAETMLAPEGLVPIASLTAAVKEGDFAPLEKELAEAIKTVLDAEEPTGAQIGATFDAACYRYLFSKMMLRRLLKSLLVQKVDRENILTALRSHSFEQAEELFIKGGKLGKKQLKKLFDADMGEKNVLKGTPYEEFFALSMKAKERGLPYTEAERSLESLEADYFYERRYELEGKEPFLYYVFRRRAEIQNVRIILVCLNAGLSAFEIRKRLRAI